MMISKFKLFGIVMLISILAFLTSGCALISNSSESEQSKGPAEITMRTLLIMRK